ncbi:hypothetical protein [Bosea sp. NPDC055594]
MNRIIRGFHRLAIVISAPVALAAILMAGLAYQERTSDVAAFDLSNAQRQAAASKKIFDFKDDKGVTFQVEAPDHAAAAAGFERFKKMAPNASPPPPGYAIDSEPGPWAEFPKKISNTFADLVPKPPKSFMQYFAVSLLTLAMAAAAYISIRAIGWVIAGFMRDGEAAR